MNITPNKRHKEVLQTLKIKYTLHKHSLNKKKILRELNKGDPTSGPKLQWKSSLRFYFIAFSIKAFTLMYYYAFMDLLGPT